MITRHIDMFSRVAGSRLSRWLIKRFNAFVVLLVPLGINRKLTSAEKAAYRGPFPTPKFRVPTAVFPHEVLASRDFLARVERGLSALADKPVLLVWGDGDAAFRASERNQFEAIFPNNWTSILNGASDFTQENNPEQISREILAFKLDPPNQRDDPLVSERRV